MSLVPIDPTNEVAVTSYLAQARDWLARAVDETGPEQIAAAKAEIATAAEATKQLGLSKEIQLDAQEMVRRAEYALGKAIRKGQAEGTIAVRGQHVVRDVPAGTSTPVAVVASVDDFISSRGRESMETFALADADAADFDAAIDEAKDEGNLSRANVARKAREKSGRTPEPAPAGTTERRHQEAELINSFGAIVRRSITRKHVATLSPKARERLISILEQAISTLKETDQ